MPTAIMKWQQEALPSFRELGLALDVAQGPHILHAIHALDQLALEARSLLARAVRSARVQGCTWDEIGVSLGITRQAAWERFRGVMEECEIETAHAPGRNGSG